AAPGQVQGGVDDLPQRVGAGPARFARALGEQVLEVGPLEIGQVTGIALPCNGIHAKKVTLTTGPAEDYFLDGQLGWPRGGQTAAVLFSVTSTWQRLGVEPWAYLQDVLTRLPTTPAGHLGDLLPDHWARAQRSTIEAASPASPAEVEHPSSC